MLRRFWTAVFGSFAFSRRCLARPNFRRHRLRHGHDEGDAGPNGVALMAYNRGPKLSAVAEQHAKLVQQVRPPERTWHHGLRIANLPDGVRRELGIPGPVEGQGRLLRFHSDFLPHLGSGPYKPLWPGPRRCPASPSKASTTTIPSGSPTRRDTAKGPSAAKEKAADMAKALGSEIAEPCDRRGSFRKRPMATGLESRLSNSVAVEGERISPGEFLAPGTIPIRIRVKVTFRLVTHGG